jgi:hypothetical protein
MPLPVTRVDVTTDPFTVHVPPGGMLVLRRTNAWPATPNLIADDTGNLGEWAVIVLDAAEVSDGNGFTPGFSTNFGNNLPTVPDGFALAAWLFSVGSAGAGWVLQVAGIPSQPNPF